MGFKTKRRAVLAAIAALAVTFASGCSGSGDGGGDEEMTLRLGFAGAVLSPGAAMYTSLPDTLGFWAEDGLKVEITRVEGTAVALSAMVSNQIDIAVVSGEAVVPAIAYGQPFVIPYSISQRGIVTTAVRADSPARGLADLSGATIGVPNLASGAVTFTKAGLSEAGVDPEGVTFVAVGTGAQAANALSSGQVDAISDTDTSVVSFQQAGTDLRVLESDVAEKLMIGVVAATTTDTMAEKKEAIEAWARGVAKATEWMQAHTEEAVKLHYQVFPDSRPEGADDEVVTNGAAQVRARLQNTSAPDGGKGQYGSVRREQLEYIIDYLHTYGLLEKPVEPDDVYDGSLIEAVNDFDRDAVRAIQPPSS